jgi:hypothetical protein
MPGTGLLYNFSLREIAGTGVIWPAQVILGGIIKKVKVMVMK